MQFSYRKWYWQLWWRSATVGAAAFCFGVVLVILLAYFQGKNSTTDTQTAGEIMAAISVAFGVLANYIVVIVGSLKLVKREFASYYKPFWIWLSILGAIGIVTEVVYLTTPLCLLDSFIPPAIALIALRASVGPLLPVAKDDEIQQTTATNTSKKKHPTVTKKPAKSKPKATTKKR